MPLFHVDGRRRELQTPDVLYRTFGRVCCSGGEAPPGVAGGFLQGLPAVSLLCLSLGERARAHMLHIDAAGALPTVDGLEWEDLVSRPPERSPGVVLLGSARFDPTPLLSRLDLAMPFAPKVGGTLPSLALYAGGEWRSGGAAGLVLDGEVALDAVVSQGAVGLGDELTITATGAGSRSSRRPRRRRRGPAAGRRVWSPSRSSSSASGSASGDGRPPASRRWRSLGIRRACADRDRA